MEVAARPRIGIDRNSDRRGIDLDRVDRDRASVGIAHIDGQIGRSGQTELARDVSAHRGRALLHVGADAVHVVRPIVRLPPTLHVLGHLGFVKGDEMVELGRGVRDGQRGVEQVGETVDEFGAERGVFQRLAQEARADFFVAEQSAVDRGGMGQRVELRHGRHIGVVTGHVVKVRAQPEVRVEQNPPPATVMTGIGPGRGVRRDTPPEPVIVARPVRVARPDFEGVVIDVIVDIDA